jgi:hypothetical protein
MYPHDTGTRSGTRHPRSRQASSRVASLIGFLARCCTQEAVARLSVPAVALNVLLPWVS